MQESINIREYLEIFKRRKIAVIIILLLCIGRGAYLTYQRDKSYVPVFKSTVSVRINNMKAYKETEGEESNNQSIFMNSISNSNLNQNIATSYSSLATSKRALLEIIQNLDLNMTPESLSRNISVVPQEKIPEFIDITVTNTDFQIAQKVANAIPEAFNNELQRVIGLDCVELLFEATEPTLVSKGLDTTLPKYTLAGLVIAIFVALLMEVLDNKVVTPDDVEKYWGVPMIGMIPYDSGKSKGKVKSSSSKIRTAEEV
ncbi:MULTISPECIES: YveK family protein [unclassified Romboutsia]|uniref:YveK family protein n=1 Tax=unclassified Romboutsia TaxID=2626894 RepID=UPI00082051F1|nr:MULTISPECIES: hypothetical protein [unclassified Romboutsia]SCH19761.1 Capsular polysaccharide type 8 biosynthesis protein cap8A [uncultured Clostridium sp.]